MSSLDQNNVTTEVHKLNDMIISFMQKNINKLILINEENEVEIDILKEELAKAEEKISLKGSTSYELLTLIKSLEKKIEDLTKENNELKEKLSLSDIQKRIAILEEKSKHQPYQPYIPNQNPLNPFNQPYLPPYTITCSNIGRGESKTNITTGFIQPVGTQLPDTKIVTTTVNNGKVTTGEWNSFTDTFKNKTKEQCYKTEGCINVTYECDCDHEDDAVCSKGCRYQNPIEALDSKAQKLTKDEFLSYLGKVESFIEDARTNKVVNKDKLAKEESKLISDLVYAIEKEANKKLKQEPFKSKISNINDKFIKEAISEWLESETKEEQEKVLLKRQKMQELSKEVQSLVDEFEAMVKEKQGKTILHG